MSAARPAWDAIWMTMAETIGQRSRCVRGSIGCVLVGRDNNVVASSYVGPPPNFQPAQVDETSTCRDWCQRSCETDPAKLDAAYLTCPSVHAEQNAVSRADFTRLRGGTAYVNASVCWQCAKLLAAAQVDRVVMLVTPGNEHRNPAKTIEYLTDCDINVTVVDSLEFDAPGCAES